MRSNQLYVPMVILLTLTGCSIMNREVRRNEKPLEAIPGMIPVQHNVYCDEIEVINQ
ncbi:MAG: hypothetical protein IPP69_10765 [Flavobacteriales bacterium]|nr:hypothetical protein [Flavobacteriales bacterium]